MPVIFEKNLPKRYVHCWMLGECTLEEVLDYVQQIALDPVLDQPFYEIVDFSQMEALDFGYYESKRLIAKYEELGESKGYLGTVFITGNIYGEAIAKMFRTLGTFDGIDSRVVDSLVEAELLIDHMVMEPIAFNQ